MSEAFPVYTGSAEAAGIPMMFSGGLTSVLSGTVSAFVDGDGVDVHATVVDGGLTKTIQFSATFEV